jgi:hypothetical protein
MRVKALLGCLLVFLTMGAIAVAGAQASASEWMIEGATLSELGLKEETLKLSGGAVTLAVPSKSLTIKCKALSGTGKILKEGSAEMTPTLTGCAVSEPASCTVGETVKIETKLHMIEVRGVHYEQLEPITEGGSMATVVLKGEKCALAGESQLKGSAAGEMSMAQGKELPLKLSEAISKTVNKELTEESKSELALTLFKQTAFISGEVIAALSGKNAGLEWQQAAFTKLCAASPGFANTCSAENTYAEGTLLKLEKENSMIFELGFVTTTCTGSFLEAGTLSGGAAPLRALLAAAEFTGCNNGCTITWTGTGKVSLAATALGDGKFGIQGIELKFGCGGTVCIYGGGALSFERFSGGPFGPLQPRVSSGIVPVRLLKKAGSGAPCAATATWKSTEPVFGSVQYKVAGPSPAFLTG